MLPSEIEIHGSDSASGHARDPRLAIRWLEISALCLFFLVSFPRVMAAASASDEAKRLVALTDYIGGDYRNAIQAGNVVNQDEYQEMLEFSSRSLELFNQLKSREGRDAAGIEEDLQGLAAHIKQKSDEKLVSELAQNIKGRLIAVYKIITYPKALPTLETGKTVYMQNCAQCHGASGRADGPGVQAMQPKKPKPAKFTDAELMNGLSPFKAFNTTTFGIERTAMPSFSALTEEERWAVAFYIFSFRFSPELVADGKRLLEATKVPQESKSVANLAISSDAELKGKLKKYFPGERESFKALAYLRRGVLEEKTDDPLLIARTLLSEAKGLYEKGEKEKAYQKAVEAYLEGFELAEPALFARNLSLGRDLEGKITAFRSALRRGDSVGEVRRLYQEIDAGLAQATELLSSGNQLADIYIFLNSSLIILREGLEAALVVAAILAFLRVTGAAGVTQYIHLGWVLALMAGILTWVLAQTLLDITGSQRESMEGFTALAAAVVLLYVGYWLHTKAEAHRWQRFVREKVHGALSKQRILTLVGISFFAVYREAFETILFYQALYLQVPNSPGPVIWGFVMGAGVLGIVVFLILKLGLKIPVNYFFGVTGAFLYVLALSFAGQGVKELQTAGWITVTPLSFPPRVDFLGIYPTVETLIAQGVVVLVFLAATLWLSRMPETARSNVT